MSDVAIRVEGLGKLYRIGEGAGGSRTLREMLTDTMAAPFRSLRSLFSNGSHPSTDERTADSRPSQGWRGTPPTTRGHEGRAPGASIPTADSREEIWALRGVSFEVKSGEVLGVIGRNGAGKSTLLKILSRITEPAEGVVRVNGRVGSLLEVGTGFHGELTGRENTYLNGAILGMTKAEIDRKFDEIVAFSEVERFIDTPVKRYSSGMFVRLAFAVAAHLDPEILIVDEVLAVGDAMFQKKCLGKMGEVAGQGRTVLFVSHNMQVVRRLCSRTILLDDGCLRDDGDTYRVVRAYLEAGLGSPAERVWPDPRRAPGDGVARLKAVRVRTARGEVCEAAEIDQPVGIEVEYWNQQEGQRPFVSVHLWNEDGIRLFVSQDFNNLEWRQAPRPVGAVRSVCWIPPHLLAEGRLTVQVGIASFQSGVLIHVNERDLVSFQVVDHTEETGARGLHSGNYPGVVRPMLEWTIEAGGKAGGAPS